MNDTMVKDITIKHIINSKISFINNNTIFDKENCAYINAGEIDAYKEMLNDIDLLTTDSFVEKYRTKVKCTLNAIDNGKPLSVNETERLSGYNNAIVFILSLINPIYEFELN